MHCISFLNVTNTVGSLPNLTWLDISSNNIKDLKALVNEDAFANLKVNYKISFFELYYKSLNILLLNTIVCECVKESNHWDSMFEVSELNTYELEWQFHR